MWAAVAASGIVSDDDDDEVVYLMCTFPQVHGVVIIRAMPSTCRHVGRAAKETIRQVQVSAAMIPTRVSTRSRRGGGESSVNFL